MTGAKKHPYATDSTERKSVMFWLAIISVVICYGIYFYLERKQVSLSYWVSAPSVFGVFGLLYLIFNEWLWKWNLLHKIRLVNVPVLDGKWEGYLKSSFDNYQSEKQITISIYQSWTEVLIVLETDSSSSYSSTASIITINPHCFTLTYEYVNTPTPAALETMHMHIGTTTLEYKQHSKEMVGCYYSGRDRKNVGDIKLKRIGNKKDVRPTKTSNNL